MELKDLLTLYRRWLWLLVLCLALGLAGGYIASQFQVPVYEASTKVLVSRSRQQSTSDMLAMSDQQLVMTYLQLLETKPTLTEVGSRLQTEIDPADVQVGLIADTQILQIKVQDQNPERAAAIANTLIDILVEQNETLQAGRYSVYEDALDAQITEVQKQIDSLQGQITQIDKATVQQQITQVDQQIADLQSQIATLVEEIASSPNYLSPAQSSELADKQNRLNQMQSLLSLYQQIQANLTFIGQPMQGATGRENPQMTSLQSTLDLYQQLYVNLLSSREAARLARAQNTPTVVSIEPASPPKRPLRPNPLLNTAISGAVGLLLAAGAVLFMDYLDDTFRTTQKVQEMLHLPVLGTVSDGDQGDGGLVTLKYPLSPQAEAFRALGASIDLSSAKEARSLVIANAGAGEGKTGVAANLAVVNAQQGKRVLLIDGDLGSPHLHDLFKLQNQTGLADIIQRGVSLKRARQKVAGLGNMTFIPSGVATTDVKRWLDVEKLRHLLAEARELVDLVIVDTPSPEVADTQILASAVDAVLVVIHSGQTPINSARATLARFQHVGAKVAGSVVDRATPASILMAKIFSAIRIGPRRKQVTPGVTGGTEDVTVSPS